MARKKTQSSSTRRWHRAIGVGASVFVVFLVISGLMLNHAQQLGLDQRHVAPAWLLNWYGLAGPGQLRSFAIDGRWLSFAGSELYLDGKPVATAPGGVGAVAFGDWLVAAGRNELLLFDHGGELIERLPWEIRGAGAVEALGRTEHGAVVVRSAGKFWQADAEMLNWSPLEAAPAATAWSIAANAPAALQQAIQQQYRGNGLSLERLLLDIHSGRIFGWVGLLVYDLLALILGFSALSGLVLWWRTRGNGQANGRRK